MTLVALALTGKVLAGALISCVIVVLAAIVFVFLATADLPPWDDDHR